MKKRFYCVKVFCTYSDTLHIRITHFLSLEIWGSWQGFLSLLSLSSAIHTFVMTDPSKRAKLPHGTIYIHYTHTLVWFTNCAGLKTCCESVACHSNSWAQNQLYWYLRDRQDQLDQLDQLDQEARLWSEEQGELYGHGSPLGKTKAQV